MAKFQDLDKVFRLLEKAFAKLSHPYHDLIINSTYRTTPQTLSAIFPEKLLGIGPSILFSGTHYILAPLENNVRVYAPSIFAKKYRLKLVNILNLAKRIVSQNRSVG